MQYIPTKIVEMIRDKEITDQSKSIIIINGFERLDIYANIAEAIRRYAESEHFSVTIKLAKRKWDKLSQLSDTATSQRMEQNEWVAMSQSVTYYRNCFDTNLLVLLGTEEEEDTGGLKNCFTIRPQLIVKELGGKYDQIFASCFAGDMGNEVKECVNKTFKLLFDCFTVDICKLNDIADEWENRFSTSAEFLEEFGKRLPEWGLPARILKPFKEKDLNARENPLAVEYKFISGKSSQKLNKSSYGKLELKLEKYAEDGEYSNDNIDWSLYKFEDYQNFANTLLEFSRSENVRQNRERLLNVDFTIINDIMKFKPTTPKEPKKSSTEKSISGEPLEVVLRSILKVLKSSKAEKLEQEIAEIRFSFKGAEINTGFANNDDEEKLALLASAWKNICVHINGIFDFLNAASDGFLGKKAKIVCKTPEFFDPAAVRKMIDSDRVASVSESKNLNKILFTVFLADADGNVLCKDDESMEEMSYSFKWCFDCEAPWLFDFKDLIEETALVEPDAARIPVGVFGSIFKSLFIKSQEEFFDLFAEDPIDLSFDLCHFVKTEAAKFSDLSLSPLCDKFDELGKAFCRFVSELSSKGFYHVLCGSALTDLNTVYTSLIDSIVSTKFDENKQWVMNAILYAFCILDDNTKYINDYEDLQYVIVPPWHPAALQKLAAQKHFLLDGLNSHFHVSEDDGRLSYPVEKTFDHLGCLAEIPSFVDIFPAKGNDYIGIFNTYGHFCIYTNENTVKASSKLRMKDLLRKEAIYDEDFKDNVLTRMNDNSQMLYDVLLNYNKAMPSAQYSLRLVFINPIDLQPIISAVYNYAKNLHNDNQNAFLNLTLTIFTRSENKGGRSCLSYWMDNCFPEEQNTKIHVYLNEWSSKRDLENLLTENNDIVFNMDVLHQETFNFVPHHGATKSNVAGCLFPILYKPSPISKTSKKRRIEITQTQFDASFKLSQVVRFKKNSSDIQRNMFLAVRETAIDDQAKEIIDILHKKAYWVVCIDRVMDGALLRLGRSENDYSIIGFSTGKGLNGQYNITITTRNSILDAVKKKLQNRLHRLFYWDSSVLSLVSDHVMNVARSLDGISVFSAINPNDENIREFIAYVLISLRESQFEANSALKVIIHLDSYKHWFDNSAKENESSMRPDFLMLSAYPTEYSVKLKATVIECKTGLLSQYNDRIEHAKLQIHHGLSQLRCLFDPESKAIDRRYWYAQLYRALVYAQVTFSDSSEEFQTMSERLRSILDGNFEIEWEGKIIGYWIDMEGGEEQFLSEEDITICNVPQALIKKYLTQNQISDYTTIDPEIIREMDDNEEESQRPVPESEPKDSPSEEEEKPTEEPVDTPPEVPPETHSETPPEASPDIPAEPASGLKDLRILIGKDRSNNDVYWEFGNEMLANRHLLITGTSGQGKTYAIQTMMYEASKHNVSIVVFDYTQGFFNNQLDPKFVAKLDGRIEQKIVYSDGVPISPFVRHEMSGINIPEKTSDVALRIAFTLSHQYRTMGDQQRNAIYNAVISGMEKHKENMTMKHLEQELEAGDNHAHSVYTKLKPFFDKVEFKNTPDYDWGNIIYNDSSKLTIFQLVGIQRDMQVIITEFLLWDLWNYAMKHGHKDKPFIVVLDEAQNLDHSDSSPSGMILTEGRKFGWSAWYATQSLKTLNSDEISRLQNSAFKMYFKPIETDIKDMSKYIDPSNPSEWTDALSNLKKGECIVVGDRIQRDGKFKKGRPSVTKVISFDER